MVLYTQIIKFNTQMHLVQSAIQSAKYKGMKENQECTNGDYLLSVCKDKVQHLKFSCFPSFWTQILLSGIDEFLIENKVQQFTLPSTFAGRHSYNSFNVQSCTLE